jgi:hypothetical protein
MKDEGDEKEDEDADRGRSDAVVLSVTHVEGAFILLLLGLACGLIVLVIERPCFRFRKYTFHPLLNAYVREFNHLKTKRRLLYLKTQPVPRCKHFSSRL